MNQLLLRDASILPSPEVLAQALGDNYAVYNEFITQVTSPEFGLTANWN